MSNLIIHIKGGTGNQLFQLAAGLSLANIYKKNCFFFAENIEKNKYARKLEIRKLLKNLGVEEKTMKTSKKIIYLDQYDIDHPLYFSKYSPLISFNNDIKIEGDFTNYRLHNLEVINKIKLFIKNIKNRELDGTDYVAIHLRELHGSGTDQIGKGVDCLNINYYSEALSQIINNSSNNIKHAIVFCDTWKNINNSQLLPKLKSILNNLGVNYINGDNLIKSPLEIINIFLFAKFSIVSNSTLSWWGAYLSEGYVFSPVMNLWEPNLKIPDHWKQIYTNEISPKTHHNKLVFQPIIRNKQNANFRIYSYKRIIIIKVFRKISSKVNYFLKLKMFLKIIQYIGLLPENPNNTYN